MLWAQGKTNAAVRLERLWDDVAKQHELDDPKVARSNRAFRNRFHHSFPKDELAIQGLSSQ